MEELLYAFVGMVTTLVLINLRMVKGLAEKFGKDLKQASLGYGTRDERETKQE